MLGVVNGGILLVCRELNVANAEALSVCEPNMLVGVRCVKNYGCRVAGGETAVVDNVLFVVFVTCKIGRRNGVRSVVAETGGAACFKISCGLNLFCISRAINDLTKLVDGLAL